MARERKKSRPLVSIEPRELPPLRPWARPAVIALGAVLLLSGALFWTAREGGFLCWDDRGYVSENLDLHPLSMQEVRDQWTAFVMGNWHPLTMLSYALDLRIAGMDARWMHTVNVLLHLVTTLLLCLLAWRLSGDPWVAVVTALLWTLHPYRVEPVAWISGRKELLMTAFGTGALLAYVHHLRRPSWKRLALSFLLFALATACKATIVALVPLLLLLDLYAGRSLRDRTVLLEKIPFAAFALVIGLVAVRAQAAEGAIDDQSAFSLGERTVLAGSNLLRYLATSVVPAGTMNFHPYPSDGQPAPVDFLLFLALPVLAWSLWRLRARRHLWFGVLFLVLNLLLVLQVIPVGMALRADRYTYLGGFGISFAIATVVVPFLRERTRDVQRWSMGLLAGYAALMGVVSWLKVGTWKDCVTFWSVQLERTPEFGPGYSNRAEAYLAAGDDAQALKDLDRAVDRTPMSGAVRMNRALVLTRMGRTEQALLDYRRALDVQPAIGHVIQANLGYTLNKLRRYKETDAYCSNSIRIDSMGFIALRNRGYARFHLGDTAAARHDLERALAIQPMDADARFFLGHLHIAAGRVEQGCAALDRAREGSIYDPGYRHLADSLIAAHCR